MATQTNSACQSRVTSSTAPPAARMSNAPRFNTLEFLGKGGQGFVQLAFDTLHRQRVAIKYIDRGWSRGFYKYVLRETLNHQQLSLCKHPHIVEFYEVFLTPSYLAVVMEYVPGTNLQMYLESAGGKLPEDVGRFIFQQLMFAVDFCHKKGKVNRDIKLANILLQEGQLPLVKLCDFGFSKDKFDDSEPQTQIGTALFTAPEIFTNVAGQVYDAEAADVWSCGVVLFVMLFGCHPFLSVEDTKLKKHAQVMKLIENAVKGNIQVPAGAEHYPEALHLISQILVSAPNQRIKLPALMSHPWFQEKLPPGAMVLNAAYLAMEEPVGELRQTPEEVQAIITAAVSVSMQPEERSETTSVAGQPEHSAISGTSMPMSHTQQQQQISSSTGGPPLGTGAGNGGRTNCLMAGGFARPPSAEVDMMCAAQPRVPSGNMPMMGPMAPHQQPSAATAPPMLQHQHSVAGARAASVSGMHPGAPVGPSASSPMNGAPGPGPSAMRMHSLPAHVMQRADPTILKRAMMASNAMDISGNVLFDSGLLYEMNLEQLQ